MDIGLNQLVKDSATVEMIHRDDENKNALRCYYMCEGDVSAHEADNQHHFLFVLSGKISVSIGLGYSEHIICLGELILIPQSAEFAFHSHERSRLVVVSSDGNYNSLNQQYLKSLLSTLKKKTYGLTSCPIRPTILHFLNYVSISMGGTLKYHAVPDVVLTLLRQEYSDTEMLQLLYPVLSEVFAAKPYIM